MRTAKYIILINACFLCVFLTKSCLFTPKSDARSPIPEINQDTIIIEAEDYTLSSHAFKIDSSYDGLTYLHVNHNGWITIEPEIYITGQYSVKINVSSDLDGDKYLWVEDYYDNKNNRTYDITGKIRYNSSSENFSVIGKDGSPLNKGKHKMKVHFSSGVKIDWVMFSLIKEINETPVTLTQSTQGDEWKIVWYDDFTNKHIDTTKWSFDTGNWGWGNDEIQYYTSGKPENARVENGNLIIEAIKDSIDDTWTSARLTTKGKASFVYGKIELRAKVPAHKGNLAAVWTLGDDYVDERSRPFCGEINILESYGFEMNNKTGKGLAHASKHYGSHYFKGKNKAKGMLEVENMNSQFHTYTVEWLPNSISAYVDNKLYASYNEKSTDLGWPYSKPQNIILNLAIGGNWAGEKGIDKSISAQQMIIDYVKVYELR